MVVSVEFAYEGILTPEDAKSTSIRIAMAFPKAVAKWKELEAWSFFDHT